MTLWKPLRPSEVSIEGQWVVSEWTPQTAPRAVAKAEKGSDGTSASLGSLPGAQCFPGGWTGLGRRERGLLEAQVGTGG